MSNATLAEANLDLVTLVVEGSDIHLVAEPLIEHNNDASEHWHVRVKLVGPLSKLRVTVKEPQSAGKKAFVKEIVHYLMKDDKIRQTFSAAKLVISAKRTPGDVAVEFTIKDPDNDWMFAADIVYPDPVYTYDPDHYGDDEDDDENDE